MWTSTQVEYSTTQFLFLNTDKYYITLSLASRIVLLISHSLFDGETITVHRNFISKAATHIFTLPSIGAKKIKQPKNLKTFHALWLIHVLGTSGLHCG
jgi:hypothetical protein